MNTLILVGAFHSIFLAVLVLFKRSKVISDYLLSTIFVFFGIFGALLYHSFENNIHVLLAYVIDVDLLFAPFYYLYIYQLTRPNKSFNYKNLLHFLPYILSTIYFMFFLTEKEYLILFNDDTWSVSIYYMFIQFAIYAAVPVYSLLSIENLRAHEKRIRENYSDEEGITLTWAKYFIFSILSIWGVFFTLEITDYTAHIFPNYGWIQWSYVISTLFILYLGIYGIKQTNIFRDQIIKEKSDCNEPVPKETVIKYEKSGLAESEAELIRKRIEVYFIEKKPFLVSRLSLRDLADQLGISTHILSEVFSKTLNSTFYEYVNKYRIEEFKKIVELDEYKNFTVIAIAFECGFNSKSSFNRVFKEVTGQTPTQFMKKLEPQS